MSRHNFISPSCLYIICWYIRTVYALEKSAPLPGFRHLSDMNIFHFLRTSSAITKASITSSTKAEIVTAAKVERNVTMKLFALLSTVHCKGYVMEFLYGTTHSGYIQACTYTLTVYYFHVFVPNYIIAFHTIIASCTTPKNVVHTHYPL